MLRKQAQYELAKDILFILIGIVIALFLSESGIFDEMLSFLGSGPVTSFLAGIFFTSAFTIAPASVALAHIAQVTPLPIVALWGALGALCGDLILFFFIRDKFSVDLENALKPSLVRHIIHSFHFGFIKWLSPVIGALIIASPLPDELGLTLMGLSKTRLIVLVPVSFIMNMVGIYALVWVAQAL